MLNGSLAMIALLEMWFTLSQCSSFKLVHSTCLLFFLDGSIKIFVMHPVSYLPPVLW
jgi:hypothetical protein